MVAIYCSNGFAIESDVILYGWRIVQNPDGQMIQIRLTSGHFDVSYDEESWPYIYSGDGYMYFVWYERIAIRVSKSYTVIEYMLKKKEYANEIVFALNFVLAFIGPFFNRLPVHACTIATNTNEAVIILGDSGIGKSTLLRGLLENGYDYISEEVAFVDASSKMVYRSNDAIRIKTESYDKHDGDELLTIVGDKVSFWNSKYSTSVQRAKLKAICMVKRDKVVESELEELSKQEMVKCILGNYLYVKTVLNYMPFVKMVDMVARMLNDTRTVLYRIAEFPDINVILDIIRSH